MISVPLIVNVTVENVEEAKIIAHDLHELLGKSGITNSIEVKENETSE
jgi:hypothetical protein